MWARVVELMLGLWLAISPLVFAVPGSESWLWVMDLSAATVVVVASVASFWTPLRRAHLLTLVIGVGLAISAWVQPRPLGPELQNHVLVGLWLAMMAIVPSRTFDPPDEWRRWT